MYDEGVLKDLGCPDHIIKHCSSVSKKALEISDRVKIKVDKEVIRLGALFHDIGRCKTHSIKHAVVGAKIARELGFSAEVVKAIERHIGSGITKNEAKKLGLPPKDYVPKTPEEKIVSYADMLTSGASYITFEESLKKFKGILGDDHPSIKRFIDLHKEIQSWM